MPTTDLAYALVRVKALDAATRTFTGVATTPDLDRQGMQVEPAGITFTNPIPLLFHHDRRLPIGVATLDAPTPEGVTFSASLPEIPEPGPLRDRVDEAWQSLQNGLIRSVSIGFRVLKNGAKLTKQSIRLSAIEICELSLVTVPANVRAAILTVKSYDADPGAASPGSGASLSAKPMTIKEQIATWEATRAATAARMDALMKKADDDGSTLDEAASTEYDDCELKLAEVDKHLVRLHAREKADLAAATAIAGGSTKAAAESRHAPIVVKPTVPPGTAFVRAACAVLTCKGNFGEAAEYARARWDSSTPEVALYLKAAVAAGNTTDATWASPLVNQGIAADFLELLRPATIIGKIPNLRRVPFNVKVPAQTAGGTYGWVGEAKPKPVTKLGFSSETLGIAKAAGIIVLTEELVRLSSPSAEALARADMVAGIAQFLDSQFIDPAVAAVAGVNPASITNGAPNAAATPDALADLLGLISFFSANNIPVGGITIILSEANALALSFQTNDDGSPAFPGIGIGGGSYKGVNFVTSQAANGNVIAVQPSLILFADDGGVTIDASREASLQMDSAPTSPADATTVLVSLWQHNLVGLRAERFINWKRANANAVRYLTGAAYPAHIPIVSPAEPFTP